VYRHCIFCSAGLGANEVVEEFPVGRTLAFDGARGRLWAVCPRCARWNLAPIEERWEAVEAAERLFSRAALRAQGGSLGLAKLPDGTKLVRVGWAPPAEVAAHRYGAAFDRRRRRYLTFVGGVTAVQILPLGVVATVAGISALAALLGHGWRGSVLHRVPSGRSPTGRALRVQTWDLAGVRAASQGDGTFRLELPHATARGVSPAAPLVLEGEDAGRLLQRVMVLVNARGAKPDEVAQALERVDRAGGTSEHVRGFRGGLSVRLFPPREEFGITPPWHPLPYRDRAAGPLVTPPEALALEIALHEEQERRALEGELTLLEAAWREAEEVAGIADRLAAQVRAVHLPRPGG
jgi:hypothetical protein